MSNFLNARDILNSQKTKEYGKTKKECSFSLKSVINYNNFVYNCIVLEGCRLASYYCWKCMLLQQTASMFVQGDPVLFQLC